MTTATLTGIFMRIHSVTLTNTGINEGRVFWDLITGHRLLSRILGEE